MAQTWSIEHLAIDEPLTACLRKILRMRFQKMWSYEAGTAENIDGESLHDMRVSARRLQAVMRIFKGAFAKKKVKKQRETLRILIEQLGSVREHNVLLKHLAEFKATIPTGDMRAIDLVIARERNLRQAGRSALVRHLRRLKRDEFDREFARFIRDAL
jgi:CHAD domain-containing protein